MNEFSMSLNHKKSVSGGLAGRKIAVILRVSSFNTLTTGGT